MLTQESLDRIKNQYLNENESYVYSRDGYLFGLSSGDKYPDGVSSTIVTFMRDDGIEIYHSISARIGIGWAIRHARGIGSHPCVLWWKVVLGSGVTIASKRYGD